jgi:hypothetical protein
MRMPRGLVLAVLPLAAAVLGSGAAAQDRGNADFQVQDVAALSDVSAVQLQPKTIYFADKTGEIADPDSGLIRFEDWAQAKPVQKQFLSLYPGYVEPMVDTAVDGMRRRYREKLQMYVAEARLALDRPPASLDLASLVSLPFIEKLDPAIKHRLIAASDVTSDVRALPNRLPDRNWCEGRTVAICINSRYQLEGKLPLGIQLANKIREGSKTIADYIDFESELTLLSPAEADQAGLAKLTGLDAPMAGALQQDIYYVNQVMQFGKLLAVFQRHPDDANRTVASIFVALAVESSILGKQKEFAKVPVLRNLVPAQVLAGKSSFNSGSSISAGLPVYARNQVKAIAGILDRR